MSFARPFVVAGAIALAAGAAQAATVNTAQLGVSPLFSGGTGPFDQTITQDGLITLDGTATGGLPLSSTVPSGDGHVEVNDGYIKLFGSAFAALNTVARGIFRDDVPITSNSVPNGTLVNVTFSLSLNGLLQPGQKTSLASYILQADFGGTFFDINKAAHFGSVDLGGAYVGDPFGTYFATVTLQVGQIAPLDVELTGSAQASCFDNGQCGDANFWLNNSLYWNGITSVTRADTGAVVTDLTATGASGVNWLNSLVPAAVPVPATLLLFGAGLAGLGIARRRR